jgi:hypothetical protein
MKIIIIIIIIKKIAIEKNSSLFCSVVNVASFTL